MQRAIGPIRAVVSRIVVIGISTQILMGLLWMFFAFDSGRDLLQLVIAFGAGYWLLGGFGVRSPFWKVWSSLALLTYPYAMQCHMDAAPDSLALSCFLLLLAAGLKGQRIVYLFWLLSACFLPEYLYFGAVPVTAFFLMSVKRSPELKKRIREIVLAAGAVVLAVVIQYFPWAEEQKLYEGYIDGHSIAVESGQRFHDSLEAAWFRRTAWSSLAQFYSKWPQEVKDVIDGDEFSVISKSPENMGLVLQPQVEAVLGEEQAREWFGDFGTLVFKENTMPILSEMAKDAGGYFLPMVMTQLRLQGRGGFSFCARNYEIMRAENPLLTRYYVNYSSWWFVIGVVGTGILEICSLSRRNKKDGAERKVIVAAGVAAGFVMIGWYTLQESSLWDPRKALFVGCLWILWMVWKVCSASGDAAGNDGGIRL